MLLSYRVDILDVGLYRRMVNARRMLNVSNMTHTVLLGHIINTYHMPIQLVKRFCKFVDLMLTSRNAIVRHFVRWAIISAQAPIGRNIAVIPHR